MNIIFAYIDLIPFNYPNSLKIKTLAIPLLPTACCRKNIGTSGNNCLVVILHTYMLQLTD